MVEKRKVSLNQAKDTGLALVLILLLIAHFKKQEILLLPAIGVVILIMVYPKWFLPLAYAWFGLAYFLGNIISKIFLTAVFILVVTPIGLIKRLTGSDPMRVKEWKKSSKSVFCDRNHLFTQKDLTNPY
jgi:multisubunit Na+/H+ antiporter MnhG subunit